eukprot:766967-Hanusia_phi.AAC.8
MGGRGYPTQSLSAGPGGEPRTPGDSPRPGRAPSEAPGARRRRGPAHGGTTEVFHRPARPVTVTSPVTCQRAPSRPGWGLSRHLALPRRLSPIRSRAGSDSETERPATPSTVRRGRGT